MRSKDRTILIPIMGGLGNQLFQFSAGIHVQKFMRRTPKFSISTLTLSGNTPREFMLGDLINHDSKSGFNRLFFAAAKLLSFFIPSLWVSETDFGDFPISRVKNRTKVLLGYFQRFVYVDSVADEILHAMSRSVLFRDILLIPSVNNIAVHIRYGDYLLNTHTRRVHGLSAMSYYVASVKLLQSEHRYDQIVIYSDNPQKAFADFSEAFGFSEIPIVMNESSSEYEDLGGMASSKGLVISNSSFSWWAAWIGSQLHECNVIAPRPWFANPTAADENLLPSRWTVLERELQP